MYRKYVTEKASEKLKQTMRMNAHTGIRIEELYPNVEKIEIHHVRDHTSFCGSSHNEGIWTITPQSEVFFLIECLNRECTSAGFNLRSVISSAIHSRMTDLSGEMRCEGQEAPDHPDGKVRQCRRLRLRRTVPGLRRIEVHDRPAPRRRRRRALLGPSNTQTLAEL